MVSPALGFEIVTLTELPAGNAVPERVNGAFATTLRGLVMKVADVAAGVETVGWVTLKFSELVLLFSFDSTTIPVLSA